MDRFWFVVIALVLLVAVFVVVFNPFKPVPTPEPGLGDENSDIFVDVNVPSSPQYSSLSECQPLGENQKADCVTQIAVKQKDAELCNSLSVDDVPWCQKEVIVAQGNESACDSLQQPQKNQCYSDFGLKNNSVNSCQKISKLYWVDDCLRSVAQHTLKRELCNLISDKDVKDDCIIRIAVETENSSLCSQVADLDSRAFCESAFEPYTIPVPEEG